MNMNELKYKLNKGFILQEVEDEMIIFDSENSVLLTFNETAAFIFKKLSKGVDVEKINTALVKTYDVTEKVARKDIENLIGSLLKKKIISE